MASLSEPDLAQLVRNDKVDILVELTGIGGGGGGGGYEDLLAVGSVLNCDCALTSVPNHAGVHG